ncbi:MAG TPA: hypothetical protein VF283_01595 [Bryobacteraceae bacterium]
MPILCPSCNGELPEWLLRTKRTETLCPNCYTALTIELFPALFRRPETIDVQNLALAEGEACCYEHATKRAVSFCNHCGRFLCALCEVEIAGAIWCPACLESNQGVALPRALEKRRTLYDSVALALSIWPVALLYPVIITAPTAIYLSIRHWKTPSSLIPRKKWRFAAALTIACAELVLIALLVVAGVAGMHQAHGVVVR